MTRYSYDDPRMTGPACSSDAMEMIISGIGGLALGAALMYVFDPKSGQQRRSHLAEMAENAWDSAGSAMSSLSTGAASAASSAGEYIHSLGDRTRDARDEYSGRLSSTYQGLRKALGDYAGDWSDSARSSYRSASKSASKAAKNYRRGMPSLSNLTSGLPRVRITREEDEGFAGSTLAASAFGALALGCAAMYFFDPRLGRGRRAYVAQKAGKFVRETGDLARKTGQHLANKSRGYYHQASGMMPDMTGDQSILQRVRSMLGGKRETENVQASCDTGCVTLFGQCDPDAVSVLLVDIQKVPGVTSVRNETRGYGTSTPTSDTGRPTPNPTAM